jgi:hypothetical protein
MPAFDEPAPDDLTIEYLPAVDEGDDFDTRPGATALYLEALGEGSNRTYLEVRSNPGTIVSRPRPSSVLTTGLARSARSSGSPLMLVNRGLYASGSKTTKKKPVITGCFVIDSH